MKYIAKLRYDEPQLVAVEIESESDKTFVVSRTQKLMGWMDFRPGRRYAKKDYPVFETRNQAIDRLILSLDESIADLEESLLSCQRVPLDSIGIVFKQRRQELGFTQADVAQKVGVSRTSIANMEACAQYPPIQKLHAIASVLSLDIAYSISARIETGSAEG